MYFDGACQRCTIDNTHVVVLVGTGRDMVAAPERAAFAERFGFELGAHSVGDANRWAHVERSFSHVEENFLAGRSFTDWEALNVEARRWCDRDDARPAILTSQEPRRHRPGTAQGGVTNPATASQTLATLYHLVN